LTSRITKRLLKLLTRKGYLLEEQGMTYLADTDPDSALAPLQSAACTYRIALGPGRAALPSLPPRRRYLAHALPPSETLQYLRR
jgi:hypothetical protein